MSTASMKGADRTRERLVESHIPLVRSIARRYAGHGESLDDLIQVGAVGLVKAGNRFDKSRGVAFGAFAAPLIEGEIRRHLRDSSSPMRIPRALQRASGELRRQRGKLAEKGHSPSIEELAAALGTDERGVESALRAELARSAAPLPHEDEGLRQRGAGGSQHGDSDERLSLARAMRALSERERTAIFLRFHADMTERRIGRELGISQAQVSRVLGGALTRLRSELSAPSGGASATDIAPAGVVPPATGAAAAPEEAQGGDRACKVERNAPGDGRPAATIGAVPATQDTDTVAHYLDLPYTVAVHSQGEGKQATWSATVEELSGCAAQGRSPDEAVERLRGAMESWFEAALAQRRKIPVPAGQTVKQRAASSTHSGRFLVRMPGVLHAELAQAAEREQLSLNRFVTNALAAVVSPSAASAERRAPGPRREPGSAQAPSRAFRIALAANAALVVIAAVAAVVLLVLALHSGV